MTAALLPTDIATASNILRGAVDVTLRSRLLLSWLNEEGRINKNAQGKDLNWLIEFRELEASPYTPSQPLTFNNVNLNVAAAVTPEWFYTTSGMNVTDVLMNSGPTAIVDNYGRRITKLERAMQNKLSADMYKDAVTNPLSIAGFGTIAKKSLTKATTNADRIAPPLEGVSYAGIDMGLGSQGGSWSADLPAALRPNAALANDWPDGHGDPSQAYDGTSPRLYNDNTNQWLSAGAAAANGTWNQNCIAMLSRANTDLDMNSVKVMMPNIHLSGSTRTQAVKDLMRISYRDVSLGTNAASSQNLGYHGILDFEGAAIALDYDAPADRTYSICSKTVELFFYGSPDGQAVRTVPGGGDGQLITGGIYTSIGPVMVPGSLEYVWILLAGGFSRFHPKWIVCHKDWTI